MFETVADQGANPFTESGPFNRFFDWLQRRQRTVLVSGVALQVVVLIGLIVHHAMPLLTGATVLLRVVPVDPRDLMRGDYVILDYYFSRVPPQGVAGLQKTDGRWPEGQTVYVTLLPESDGQTYRADKFTVERPQGGMYLRGKIGPRNRIDFGIESYYVQEGTGRKYEKAVIRGKLFAEVAISPSGQATLKGLQIK